MWKRIAAWIEEYKEIAAIFLVAGSSVVSVFLVLAAARWAPVLLTGIPKLLVWLANEWLLEILGLVWLFGAGLGALVVVLERRQRRQDLADWREDR